MHVNLATLMDVEVSKVLVKIAQVIPTHVQSITTLDTSEGAPRLDPYSSTMARRLRDFTRMNLLFYFAFKTNEDPQDFMDEVYKIIIAMGVNEKDKAEFDAFQLKDVGEVW